MSAPMSAQRKQIGEARTILKSGKNLEQAEKLMTDLLKDSANQQNVRIYDIWLQSVEKQYLAINEKMYIKQKVDTAAFFNLAKRMFTVAEKLDSIDAIPDKKAPISITEAPTISRRAISRPHLNSLRPISTATDSRCLQATTICTRTPRWARWLTGLPIAAIA